MAQLFANNAVGSLSAGITSMATTLTLNAGQGALFPAITGTDWFSVTLTQATGIEESWEIVKCTARSGDVLTVTRAQEGTPALAWPTGKVELRLTAKTLLSIGNLDVASVGLLGATTIYAGQTILYTITDFDTFTTYSAGASAGSASYASGVVTFTAPMVAGAVTLTVTASGVPRAIVLSVLAAGVEAPTITNPLVSATGVTGPSLTITSSAFVWTGVADTHLNSDFELWSGQNRTGTLLASSYASAVNKTSWTVAVAVSTTYYPFVLHRGTSNGASAFSASQAFTTAASFGGAVGVAGAQAFGVGVCPSSDWLTELGLNLMTGTTDKTHDNYGNYLHTNGGTSCFVPKFFYKFGDSADSAFAAYGANTLTIKGIETFSGEAAANIAGYAMHRAFFDGGLEKPGFFIDKYLASKDGTTSCKSLKLGNPISLTTNANYNPSNGMTGCTGILADAVVLSRARGAGWNSELAFQRDAIAKISLAHAQHAAGTTFCAWWSAGATNFPKGCNSSLADVNDTTVTFTTAGVSGDTKPLTGSASNLAKTTHNGQLNGIADINGSMFQALLGLTQAGTSATDTVANTTGNAYLLKRSIRHSTLTGGFGGTNDAWGTTASLATNFDLVPGFLPWTSTTGVNYFGSGANQVFSGATSGTDYLRSCTGVALQTGMDATGTNQFGNDYNYRYSVANLFPMASGYWSSAADAGMFLRSWNYYRSYGRNYVGFRSSAYGS